MKQKQLYIKSILCALTFAACQSHEQKADEAYKHFKVEKTIDIDSTIIFKDSANQLLKTLPNKKVIKIDEYLKYKNELEAKVKTNDIAIIKLKEEHQSNTKIYRKIQHLGDVNGLLLNQLKEYEETVKNNRKAFEEKINQELNDVNLSITEYNSSK